MAATLSFALLGVCVWEGGEKRGSGARFIRPRMTHMVDGECLSHHTHPYHPHLNVLGFSAALAPHIPIKFAA